MALTRITSSVIRDASITETKFDTEYLNATGAPDTGQQSITLESNFSIRVGQGSSYFSAAGNTVTLTAPAATDTILDVAAGNIVLSDGNITLSDAGTRVNTPKLQVALGSESAPSIYFGDSTSTGFYSTSTPLGINLSVGGADQIRFSPTEGVIYYNRLLKIVDSADTAVTALSIETADDSVVLGGSSPFAKVKVNDDVAITVRSEDTNGDPYTSDDTRVGINESNPQATLDVNGSIRADSYQNITASDLPVIPVTSGGTGFSSLGNPEQLIRVNAAGTALEFFTQNTGDVNNVASFGVSGDDTIYKTTARGTTSGGNLTLTFANYTDDASNTVTQVVNTWGTGQTIKIFGVNTKDITEYDSSNTTSSSIFNTWKTQIDTSSQVTTAAGNSGSPGVSYTYYARLLNVNTGVISSFHKLNHVGYGAETGIVKNYPLSTFNEQRFNSVVVFRPDANHAVLIYRFHNDINAIVSDSDGNALTPSVHNARLNLIAILGQRDIGSAINLGPITFKDYGAFDRTTWSDRNTDGTYNQDRVGIINVPCQVIPTDVPTAKAIPGWVERTVTDVDYDNKTVTVSNSTDSAYDESDLTNTTNIVTTNIQAVHDDTAALQTVINDVLDKGLQSLFLTGGTYLVKNVVVPPNFSLGGSGKATVLKKQYFDTSWQRVSNGELGRLYSVLYLRNPVTAAGAASNTTSQPIANVTVRDLVVDGNYNANIRLGNLSSPEGNALVYATGVQNCSISSVDIKHSIGDGIFAIDAERLSLQNCFVSDNSSTYLTFDNPLNATNASVLKVSDCAFINNPGPADITTSEVVAFNSCIIRNSGTGLRIYGTRSANTENNLILGPDDEWIPTTDTYDSDFNSVNIICNKTTGTGTNGNINVTYTEENVAKDLTSATFTSIVKTVTVDVNGNETLSSSNLTYNQGGSVRSVLEVGAQDLLNGIFTIQIPSAAVGSIPYRTVQGTVGINYNYIVYYVNATEEVPVGGPDDYNITGVFNWDSTNYIYSIKITDETVSQFTIGDIVTLQEHNPSNGYSLPTEMTVNNIRFVNQSWVLDLTKGDFATFNTQQNNGSITIDPAAEGYIKKKRTITIVKGIIGVV